MKITRYTLVQRAGIWLDAWTAQLWDLLVAKFPGLILTQGVNSGAAASGGTHLGLGVLDLYLGKWASKWRDVLRYAFDIGFFGWYRPELWTRRAGKLVRVWKTHIHLGVRGCVRAAASLKAQFTSWLRKRNGLQGDGPDAYTYRPANASKAAPYKEPTVKPPKPARTVHPWINASFLNAEGNSDDGRRTFESRAPQLAATSAAGSPALAGFSEVSSVQLPVLTGEMDHQGYDLDTYSHMMPVYRRRGVVTEGSSFEKYNSQDGGTTEGVLRVKVRVDGSAAQVFFTHLDHDSTEGQKRSNLKQVVASAKRFGKTRLRDQWRERTLIIGDFNQGADAVGKVLRPLGFKLLFAHGIDQAWVGAKRPTRGGAATKTKSDHPRILARLGKY